jgi:hypothetical protein
MTRPRPAFIVGTGRSGTTLLRMILDAHDDVGCPGEAGMGLLVTQLGRVWFTICTDRVGARVPRPPSEVRRALRRALFAPMTYYCAPGSKRVFCDKSLDTADHLFGIHQVMPEARYVLMFRHPLDVVASGIEASPYGFRAFGYAPFIAQSVDNFVAALLRQWTLRVSQALTWERLHPRRCVRVRYEDLVLDTACTTSTVFRFLGVEADGTTVARALERARLNLTPGDPKIAFTREIHTDSIGRGRNIPLSLIPLPLRTDINEQLGSLGYPEITYGPRGELAQWGPPAPEGTLETLEALMPRVLELRSGERMPLVCALVVDDVAECGWTVDLQAATVTSGASSGTDATMVASARDLVRLLNGEENPASMFAKGLLRYTLRDGPDGQGGEDAEGRTLPVGAVLLARALSGAGRSWTPGNGRVALESLATPAPQVAAGHSA